MPLQVIQVAAIFAVDPRLGKMGRRKGPVSQSEGLLTEQEHLTSPPLCLVTCPQPPPYPPPPPSQNCSWHQGCASLKTKACWFDQVSSEGPNHSPH